MKNSLQYIDMEFAQLRSIRKYEILVKKKSMKGEEDESVYLEVLSLSLTEQRIF